uniref:Uncharacterized protein n=2 Tax=Pyrodinium bahamense TaxID=73915 RepID=A0A7S0AL65_9DINO
MVVHQQQQSQEPPELCDRDRNTEKAVEDVGRPIVELEQQCSQRFAEQEERMDKILQMVDTLADRVIQQQPLQDESGAPEAGEQHDQVGELREKVEDLEANLYGLAAQVQAQEPHQQQPSSGLFGIEDGSSRERFDGGVSRESFVAAMESLEARVDRNLSEVDRSLNEVCQRVDSLQEGRDQQRLTLRQMSNELPEVSQKLDQLWAQCQYYFPRVKEHDVHFSFFRTSFENHKQHMLDFTDGLERDRLIDHGSLTPADAAARSPAAAGGGDRFGLGLGLGLGRGFGSPGTGLAGDGGGDRPGHGLGLAATAPPASCSGVTAAATAATAPGTNGASGFCEDGPRARMLAQVMARLYSDRDELGAGHAANAAE